MTPTLPRDGVSGHAGAAHTAYYYTPETNNYGADGATTNVAYTRAGYLSKIDYGLRLSSGSIYGSPAPDEARFTVSDRTDSTGWPDTPTDQDCSTSSTCSNHSPTFWTRKRLTAIDTYYYTGSGTTYQQVDDYALAQEFPTDGDPQMQLDSITRTGYSGSSNIKLPKVSFVYQEKANRVDGYNNQPAMLHERLTQITAETGQITMIAYEQAGRSPAPCTGTTVPSDASQDTSECFSVVWTPPYNANPIHDYFHKYVTTEVDVQDPNGVAPMRITTYTYLGGAAWHYDDNELVKPADRTYGQFRGYGTVQVRTGNPNNSYGGVADKYTLTTTTYYRGMYGDTLPSGTRTTQVTDSLGESVNDTNDFADTPREVQTFNGDGGAQLSTTITTPTTTATTATRARTGLPALTALMVRTANARTYTALAAGGTRLVRTDTAYDSAGRPIQRDDTGTSVATVCTTTSYAANPASSYTDPTTAWIRDRVSEVIKSAQTCPTYGTTPNPILSDVRTYYDNSSTLGAVSSQGLATRTDTATTNTSSWATTKTGYDSSGREASTTVYTNSADTSTARTTSTSYTPADGGPLTGVKVTYPAVATGTQTSSTTLDPGRGVTTETVDVSGLKTDAQYDAMGRLTSVWKPGQVKGTDPATATYSYVMNPASVTTKTLVDPGAPGTPGYVTSVSIYDAFGTLRQTQTDAVGGGRVITDNFTDSHGWTIRTNNRWVTTGAPAAPTTASNIPTVADSGVDSRTVTSYDGSGRPVLSTDYKGTTASWSTQTVYGGDRTTVVPPTGGVEQTAVTDARGNQIELDQWTTAPAISGSAISGGVANQTTYQYTPLNQRSQLTTAAGTSLAATWTWSYDLAGRVVSQSDPDAGTTTSSYDDLGELTATTDAKNQTVSYVYDALGRKIQSWVGAPSLGTELGSWVYDTLQAGQLTSSTSYNTTSTIGVGAYTVAATGYDANGNPTGTTTTIPAPEMGGAAGSTVSYTTSYSWTSTHLMHTQTPAPIGNSPAETITYQYDTFGEVNGVTGVNGYLSNATYSAYGEPVQYGLGNNQQSATLSYNYDAQTRRISSVVLSALTAIPQIENTAYTYDPAGNLLRSDDTQGGGTGAPVESQCYSYDPLDQLSRAWSTTPANTCAASDPTTSAGTTKIGGPQPYWQSWTYDAAGGRLQQILHAVPSGLTTSTTTAYTNGVTGHAHALASTTTSGGQTGSTSYGYDADGNTTTRTLSPTNSQTLSYTPDGHLDTDTVTNSSTTGNVNYIYAADGHLLASNDSLAGTTTIYLPGEELTRNTGSTALTATRYYSVNGTVVSVRVNHGNPTYIDGDLHGTNQVALPTTAAGFGTVSRRHFDPYGNPLGNPSGTWPEPHAFLNQPTNTNTGLDQLGARQYDPTAGRFTTVDPVLETGSPTQLNGYTYAANNPTTNADPSGQMIAPGDPGAGFNTFTGTGQIINTSTVQQQPVYGGPPVNTPPTAAGNSGADTFMTLYNAAQAKMLNQIKQINYANFMNPDGPPLAFTPQQQLWMQYMDKCGGDIGDCYVAFEIALGMNPSDSQGEQTATSVCVKSGDIQKYCGARYDDMSGVVQPDTIGQFIQDSIVTLGVAGLFKALAAGAADTAASGAGPAIDKSFQFGGAGRSGAGVKNFVGPQNSVVRGASQGRVFVTDDQGRVVLDITRDRVKLVIPGQGFVAGGGRKLVPTQQQLDWIDQLWGN